MVSSLSITIVFNTGPLPDEPQRAIRKEIKPATRELNIQMNMLPVLAAVI